MSSISAPSGRLPDMLVNNSNCTYLKTSPAKPEDTVVAAPIQANKHSADYYERQKDEIMKAIKEGRVKHIEVPKTDSYDPALEGKTVVKNISKGMKLESLIREDGTIIRTAGDYENAAKAGAATHAFLYEDFDFLLDAAKDYATLGENEVFAMRDISDDDFVRHTLDFFTDGNFTSADIKSVQNQITDVVYELAEQLKNGEMPDLNKLQSTLTIGGADVTIGQLMDFQKFGQELKESVGDSVTVGSLSNHNVTAFAKIGMMKAMGDYYGSDKGKIGEMFSSAMGKLSEKAVAGAQRTFDAPSLTGHQWNASERDSMDVGLKTAELFTNLDTSSKESLSRDFASKLSSTRSIVQNYCSKYGMPTSYVGLASATSDITKFFESWMNKI